MKFGNTRFQSSTPAIDATPDYSAGDAIASAPISINLTSGAGGRGLLNQVSITDKANQKPVMTLLFFSALPTGTYTKNSAVALSAADRLAFLGKIEVASTDWSTLSGDAVATVYGPLTLVGAASGPGTSAANGGASSFTAYCVPVAQGAYNAGAVDDLTFGFGTILD